MEQLRRFVRVAPFFLIGVAVFKQMNRNPDQRTWTGHVFGIPYDFRPPTVQRTQERWWNPKDERLFTPHVFGLGWSVNLYQLRRRLRPSAAREPR